MYSPRIAHLEEPDGALKFTLTGVPKSFAIAIQRTILSDIPTVVFRTTPYSENKANIIVNTSRLHNEIIKQRLACIPVCEVDATDPDIGKWLLEVDVENTSDKNLLVTTQHFQVKNTETHEYLHDSEVRKMFPAWLPPTESIEYFTPLTRLRPKLTDTIPGEKLKLTCEFSVGTARQNASYNVVGTMAVTSTPDPKKQQEALAKKQIEWKEKGKDIAFETKNWWTLDALRCVLEDSHDFLVKGIGVYDNKDIVVKACGVLVHKFADDTTDGASKYDISASKETTIPHCYDVIVNGENHTMGNILQDVIYAKHYDVESPSLTFCGFKKMHPHDNHFVLRLAFVDATQDANSVRMILKDCAADAIHVFEAIRAKMSANVR